MNINGMEITIGADPEIFVAEAGQFICAHGLVPGDKQNPHPVEHGAVQVDGMALEFNINPAHSYEEFQHNLDKVQGQLQVLIGEKEFLDVASVIFSEEFLRGVPHEALILGCEPDYNAYSMEANPSPDGEALMRTAGGHIHIGGWSPTRKERRAHTELMARLTRLMDEEVGAPSVLWDEDDKRRSMYGKAGCLRIKSYGMEYRTLSNAWLFDKKITKFVYEGTIRAVKRLFNGEDVADDTARQIIDTSNRSHPFLERFAGCL